METEEMKLIYKRTATKYREVHITDYGTAAFGVSSLYTYIRRLYRIHWYEDRNVLIYICV
jgi:hypothetical protein